MNKFNFFYWVIGDAVGGHNGQGAGNPGRGGRIPKRFPRFLMPRSLWVCAGLWTQRFHLRMRLWQRDIAEVIKLPSQLI